MAELSKRYDPKSVEPKWYQRWMENRDFPSSVDTISVRPTWDRISWKAQPSRSIIQNQSTFANQQRRPLRRAGYGRTHHLLASRCPNRHLPRCMSDSRPIGVFDSGIGGLTVV